MLADLHDRPLLEIWSHRDRHRLVPPGIKLLPNLAECIHHVKLFQRGRELFRYEVHACGPRMACEITRLFLKGAPEIVKNREQLFQKSLLPLFGVLRLCLLQPLFDPAQVALRFNVQAAILFGFLLLQGEVLVC